MNDQIRRYQLHFVWTSLGLFTLALVLAFSVLAVFVQHSNMEHVEVAMRQAAQNPPSPLRTTEQMTESFEPTFERIIVVTVGPGGEVTTVSGSAPSADDVTEALTARKSFGVLRGRHTFYCRDKDAEGNLRLAFLSMRSYRRELVGIFGPMFLILCAEVLCMVPMSRYLARSASKPLVEALEGQRRFTADVSHNLKTPLTVILTSESILARSPEMPEAERLDHLDKIRTAGGYMNDLITGMLELAALEAGADSEPRTRLDLTFLTGKACLQMDDVAFEQGVALTTSVASGIFCVGAERHYLRMLTSLIDNALKYEPPGGGVDVCLRAERRTAVVTVTNRLTVIAAEDLPRVFDRFYRGGEPDGSSFGLGLPLARSAAEELGGTLTADNDPDAGARFTARLPLSD